MINLTDRNLKILALYNEPHRYYHTVSHVLEMLQLHITGETRGIKIPDYKKPQGDDLFLIEAVIAHDCVYQIGALYGENEQRSYDAWKKIVGMDFYEVQTMILATISHTGIDGNHHSPELIELSDHLIDLDLAALAMDEAEFDRNTENLRKEYIAGGGDPSRILAGRKSFLRMMLERDTIFRTPQFRNSVEGKARANLSRSLQQIEESYEQPTNHP